MARARKLVLVSAALCAAVIIAVMVAGPAMQRSFFYPKPRGLPPVVGDKTQHLLARLEAVLETNASVVARALQPGLSDSEIARLETEGGFHLSDDLRALYRWHNGMSTNSVVGLLPGQRFVPLDEVVCERALLRQQLASATSAPRAEFRIFAGHRKTWVQILDDRAGDGYFYDPERSDAGGAFFHHFAEGGYYMWFPSLRNFLAGAIECYETHSIKVAPGGKDLEEDTDRAEKIWSRFGKSTGG